MKLIHRGRGLRVQGDREGADAVIEGVIKSFTFSGVLLDDKGRARIFEVTIEAAVTVRDQTENRVLYDNQNFVFRASMSLLMTRATSSVKKIPPSNAWRAALLRVSFPPSSMR